VVVPRKNRKTFCKDCGGNEKDVGLMSWNGLCRTCGERRMIENNRQISAHQGPYFLRQRHQTLRAWGGIPAELVHIIE
jgi:hypothetical protein